MSVRIRLRLNLSKIKKTIEVRYNTYEKAMYDQYLIACLAKETKCDANSAFKYIDEITGSGSLNAHFKKLFNELVAKGIPTIDNVVNRMENLIEYE